MGVSVNDIAVKILKFDEVEKKVSFAIKAQVSNTQSDEYSDEDVSVEIQGVDAEGFEILTINLSGHVKFDSSSVLTDREDDCDKAEFIQVVNWQYVGGR
ncbi:hypothetical protein EC844_11192 [Acinetobacter calcoaceticus]|uniref:Uncharacterized protein n=1 Tax=Acinetobacter calcoaceticus TaxID=471 RepID=A0A4R1XU67_ACICA|nr:hypothetical protein EC844_11192 [Acinetobacter calcoaceticus]